MTDAQRTVLGAVISALENEEFPSKAKVDAMHLALVDLYHHNPAIGGRELTMAMADEAVQKLEDAGLETMPQVELAGYLYRSRTRQGAA